MCEGGRDLNSGPVADSASWRLIQLSIKNTYIRLLTPGGQDRTHLHRNKGKLCLLSFPSLHIDRLNSLC